MSAQFAWQVELFGGLRARYNDREMPPLDTRKTVALFACLALNLDQSLPREVLAEQLWPGEAWEATRNRMRQALSVLRRALEPSGVAEGSVLASERGNVRLLSSTMQTDVAAFNTALRRATRTDDAQVRATLLQEAAVLYAGELLPGFYENWIVTARERYVETYHSLLFDLARAQMERGDAGKARDALRRIIQENPLREDAHRLLIQLYVETGRQAEAVQQYQYFEKTLQDKLGLRPSADTTLLVTKLQQNTLITSPPDSARLRANPAPIPRTVPLSPETVEPDGGAIPLGSPYYLEREADTTFATAIARCDSIVLVKGARQIGKTSLLARGLQQARDGGSQVVLTDLQKLDPAQMESPAHLFETFAEMLADQLGLEPQRSEYWNPERGWNVNFERFLRRHVLTSVPHLVWGLDEIDRLFDYSYKQVVFGLFRSWHNERSLNPDGPWGRLTLAIAYATEAHLFITDLNQSPFNVGTRLGLEDFTVAEVAELNRRFGTPVAPGELNQLTELVGGHPYLVRRALQTLKAGGIDLAQLSQRDTQEEGPFGDHLRRLLRSLTRDTVLCQAIQAVLRGEPCPTSESFYRLRSAGVLTGTTADPKLRCGLYHDYLERRLP